jgi:hypothetical protein
LICIAGWVAFGVAYSCIFRVILDGQLKAMSPRSVIELNSFNQILPVALCKVRLGVERPLDIFYSGSKQVGSHTRKS